MQKRAAIWITRAFCTSPTAGIKAIAGLIPIHLHLQKLYGCVLLQAYLLPQNHIINLLSRSLTVDFIFSFHFIFLFFFFYFILFSIFRTTQVRGYLSRCHIKSQDWLQDLGEWSRRFWNKVMSYNMDNTCWPHVIHMVIRVGCTVVSMDHE